MPSIKELRQQYKGTAYDTMSDYDIVNHIAGQNGAHPDVVAYEYGIKLPKNDPNRGAVSAGIASGADQIQGIAGSTVSGFGDFINSEGLTNYGQRVASKNYTEAAAAGREDLERLEDQTLGSAIPFAAYQVGKQVPTIAAAIASTALVPEAAIPTAASRAGAIVPRVLGGGGLRAGMTYAERQAAEAIGKKYAADVVGAGAFEGGMGFGSMYQESVDAGNPDATRALAMSPLYGVSGALLPAALKGTLTRGAAVTGSLPRRMATTGGIDMLGEAGVELGQNELEMSFNPNLSREEVASRRLNAAAIGGLVGGSFGAVGGIRSPNQPQDLLNSQDFQDYDEVEDFAEPVTESPQGDVPKLGNYPNEIMVNFPDGSTGTQAQVDAYVAQFPENQQNAARAKLLGYPANPDLDPSEATVEIEPLSKTGKFTFGHVADVAAAAGVEKILPSTRRWISNKLTKLTPDNIEDLRGQNLSDTQYEIVKALDDFYFGDIDLDTTNQAANLGSEEEVAARVANIIEDTIPEAQAKWWGARLNPVNENLSDAKLAKQLGYSRQNASKLAKRSNTLKTQRQVLKAVSTEFGISQQDAEGLVGQFLVRNRASASEDMTGMAPELQDSVLEQRTGAGGTSGIGSIQTVGGSQGDVGGEAVMPLDYDPNDVTPSAKTLESAGQGREALYQELLQNPETKNAKIDYNDFAEDFGDNPWEMLPPQAQMDWAASYIETVDLYNNEGWNSQQFEDALSREYGIIQADIKGGTYDQTENANQRLIQEVDSTTQRQKRAISQNVASDGSSTAKTPAARKPEQPLKDYSDASTLITGLNKVAKSKDSKRALIAKDFVERAKQGENVQAEATKWLNSVDKDNLASKGRPMTLVEEVKTGARGAIATYEKAGLGLVKRLMGPLVIKAQPESGLITFNNGTNSFEISLDESMIDEGDSSTIAHTVRHELAHGLDFALNWDLSNQPSFMLSIKNGEVVPEGAVAKELLALHNSDKLTGVAKELKEYLDYPLNRDDYGDLDAREVRAELFAQLQSAWLLKGGKDVITKFLPKSAKYLEGANNYAKNRLPAAIGDSQGGTSVRGSRASVGNAGQTARANQEGTAKGETKKSLASMSHAFQYKPEPEAVTLSEKIGFAVSKISPKLLTFTQLVEQFGGKLTSLKDQMDLQNLMVSLQVKLRDDGHRLLEDWNTLATSNKATNDRLMRLMNEATRLGIHPDRAFNAEGNEHLSSNKDKEAYNRLRAQWKTLPNEAKAIYKRALRTLENNWKLRKEIFSEVIVSAYEPRIEAAVKDGDTKQAERLQLRMQKEIDMHAAEIKSLKGPYFPLMRFGDYILVAESEKLTNLRQELAEASKEDYEAVADKVAELEKSSKHYIVEAFESRTDLENRSRRLATKMNVRQTMADKYSQEIRPVTAGAVEKLNESLGNKVDSKSANALRDLVTQMYVTSLPEHHALQRQIKRKGVAGSTDNMMRSFGEAIERDSFYLSRMKYSKDITSNLFKMSNEAKKLSVDEQEIYNSVMSRVNATYQFERTPWIDSLARASSIFHLGVAPSFLLTNMSQPWMITAPQLAGKFGITKTFSSMRTAWADSVRIIKQGKGGELLNLADVDFSEVSDPEERALLERLADLNKLAGNQVLDMGMLADGASPKTIKANKAFAWATHHIELVNRISTALASYRLEKARNPNASEASLQAKAVDMVDKTQLDYSGENAAPFMHTGMGLGKLKKLIFQFRKYQQGMLYLLFRNGQLAAKGDKEAMRSLGYLISMQVAFAGAVGIPASNIVLGILNLAFDDDDEKGDAETRIRNYLSDTYGADAARVMWKGLPTMLGLDVSRNIGMGSLFDPLPMARWSDITQARTGKNGMSEILFQSSGAAVGMMSNIWDGARLAADGDVLKGMGRMSPKFIGSIFKAVDMNENGLYTRSGNEVIPADSFDAWDIAYKAAGFNPTLASEHYEAQTAKEGTAAKIKERRDRLLKDFAAKRLNSESPAKVRKLIREFNRDHPSSPITEDNLKRAVSTRVRNRRELNEVGVRYRKQDAGLRGIDRFAK